MAASQPEHSYSRYTKGCRCDACRAAAKAYAKRWRAANEERSKQTAKEWYARKRDELLAYQREWNEKNREKMRRNQREFHHRHKVELVYKAAARNRKATRRAKKRNQFLEEVDAATVYEMHGGRCGICDEFIDGDFHVDHIRPLSRGGLHAYINVQPAHAVCNMRKGGDAKWPSAS